MNSSGFGPWSSPSATMGSFQTSKEVHLAVDVPIRSRANRLVQRSSSGPVRGGWRTGPLGSSRARAPEASGDLEAATAEPASRAAVIARSRHSNPIGDPPRERLHGVTTRSVEIHRPPPLWRRHGAPDIVVASSCGSRGGPGRRLAPTGRWGRLAGVQTSSPGALMVRARPWVVQPAARGRVADPWAGPDADAPDQQDQGAGPTTTWSPAPPGLGCAAATAATASAARRRLARQQGTNRPLDPIATSQPTQRPRAPPRRHRSWPR